MKKIVASRQSLVASEEGLTSHKSQVGARHAVPLRRGEVSSPDLVGAGLALDSRSPIKTFGDKLRGNDTSLAEARSTNNGQRTTDNGRRITSDERRATSDGKRGISLMELMVAMGIFSIVIAMATGIFQYYFKIKRKIDVQQTMHGQIKLGLDLMCKDLRGMTFLVNTEFKPLTKNIQSGKNNDIDITNTGTANDDNDNDGYCNEDPIGDRDNPNTPDIDESGDGDPDDDADGQIDEDDIDRDSNDSIIFNDYDVIGRGQAEGLAAGVPYTSNVIDDDNDGQMNEDKVVDGTDNDSDGFDGEDPEHGIGIGYKIRYRILDGKLVKDNLTLATSKPLVENVVGLSIICRDGTEQTINTNADIEQVRSIEMIMAVSKDGITEVLGSKVYPRILQP